MVGGLPEMALQASGIVIYSVNGFLFNIYFILTFYITFNILHNNDFVLHRTHTS